MHRLARVKSSPSLVQRCRPASREVDRAEGGARRGSAVACQYIDVERTPRHLGVIVHHVEGSRLVHMPSSVP